MSEKTEWDVIIVGGSYAGLSAAMCLGRAISKVLIIDSGKPCNRQAVQAHNFITQDGEKPAVIAAKAKEQVLKYPTIKFQEGKAVKAELIDKTFQIEIESGEKFTAQKLLFATGVKDIMLEIPGFKECWGISIAQCPYCHGYEIRDNKIGLIGNGEMGYEFVKLISNWSKNLVLFTNGKSTFTDEQMLKIKEYKVEIIESEIKAINHDNGYIKNILLADGSEKDLQAIFTALTFEQHCKLPAQLGCELTDAGFIKIDAFGKTSIDGIFAAGDNSTPLRTLSMASSSGTVAGAWISKELIGEHF